MTLSHQPPPNCRTYPRKVAPTTNIFGTHDLEYPDSIDPGVFSGLKVVAEKKQPAPESTQFWEGDPLPWRDGSGNPITDPGVIAKEEELKARAEAEDTANEWGAEKLRARGVRVDFLVALTMALDLWEWKTWEVVQLLVKPATSGRDRCRFADLPEVGPFTGPATVFMSHCWGGRWGDLVAATASGAQWNRVVWVDIFAVREPLSFFHGASMYTLYATNPPSSPPG